MFDKKPKLHWKAKIFIFGFPVFFFIYMIFGMLVGDGETVFGGCLMTILSFIPGAVLLHIYFRDLRAFEDQFRKNYGISYEEYQNRLRHGELENKATDKDENLSKPEQEPQIHSAPNSTIVEQNESGYQGRPGSLSFQEISDRREKMQPVYVAARHCYGIIERDEDRITLEDGKKISLYGAFFSGLYDHETDEEHLDMGASPEGALSYRQLIRMDRRPVYVPKYDSWGSVNVEEQVIQFNKSVVPYAYGKTNRIGLYEASKLGVYEEDVTK